MSACRSIMSWKLIVLLYSPVLRFFSGPFVRGRGRWCSGDGCQWRHGWTFDLGGFSRWGLRGFRFAER